LGDQIKEKEMSRAYVLYGKGRGSYRIFVGKPDGTDHLVNLRINGRKILKDISKT
jgi:hypothetical protein